MKINSHFLKYTFLFVSLLFIVSMSTHADEYTFTRINNMSELNDGDNIIVVNENFKKALSEWNGTTEFSGVSINIDDNVATTSDYVTVFQVEKYTNYYYLRTSDGKYLSNASTTKKNACELKDEPDETSKANISFSEDHFVIRFEKNVDKSLLYFSTNNCFNCYNSDYKDAIGRMISLYKSESQILPPNPPHLQPTTVKFSYTSVSIIKGEDYTLPIASVVLENGDVLTDAQLVYSSSDENVASVDETTGEITLNNFGRTIIKAQYKGSDVYEGSEGTYILDYRDQLGTPTIVFSAANGAFSNLASKKPSSTTIWHDIKLIADDGVTYNFKHQDCYKGQKGFMVTANAGYKHLRGPIFDAPNGYIVRFTYDKKPQNSHPYVVDEEQMSYNENGEGDISGTKEYECIKAIPDSTSFVFIGSYIYYIKKIEIFINSVPSVNVSDKDKTTIETLKKNDEKVVQFKLNRSFVNDGNWYTICLPFNVSQQRLQKAFGADYIDLRTFDYMEGTTMYFKKVEDIEAGVPYLIKPNADIEEVAFDSVKIAMTSNPTLQVGMNGYYMQGVYKPTELQTNGTNLFLGNDNRFFKPIVTNNTMNGMRAYFIVPNSVSDNVLRYDTDAETSGVIRTELGLQQKNHKVYNINGIYVGNNDQNLMPGTYIVDGKKIIISN